VLDVILPNTDLNLFARTLEIILYIPPPPHTKLIGGKSFTSRAQVFFGIKETKVALRLFSN
jgi:hypothetical protein